MMDQPNELERDVRALAEILIGRYGERAVSYAALQALRAKSRDEPRVMEAWRWIGTAVVEVLRTDPDWEAPAPRTPRPAARAVPVPDGQTRRIARLFAPAQAYES